MTQITPEQLRDLLAQAIHDEWHPLPFSESDEISQDQACYEAGGAMRALKAAGLDPLALLAENERLKADIRHWAKMEWDAQKKIERLRDLNRRLATKAAKYESALGSEGVAAALSPSREPQSPWQPMETEGSRYRKKPVVIDAVQWTGANAAPLLDWIGDAATQDGQSLIIHTLEGDHEASLGDWIIKGVKGEFYPCKSGIFAMTYEAAPPAQCQTCGGAKMIFAADINNHIQPCPDCAGKVGGE